jgi:hypothetical protein
MTIRLQKILLPSFRDAMIGRILRKPFDMPENVPHYDDDLSKGEPS